MKDLTKTQKKLLSTIEHLKQTMGMSPTVKEIADALFIKAPSVHEALRRLEEKGYIHRSSRKARSIEILKSFTVTSSQIALVPLIGKVAAGTPILAQENKMGEVVVPQNIVNGTCFALEVQGDSMIEADIWEGDYIIVRQQPIAENNDIIVAMLKDEATVKRLFISDEIIELRPENAKLEPIKIRADDELKIIGKVLHVCSKSDRKH